MQPDANDLTAINTVLPGLPAQFRTTTPQEVAQLPRIVDPQLLEGTTVNFSRSMIRLAWILQHVETLLPMAGEIQAELNWGLVTIVPFGWHFRVVGHHGSKASPTSICPCVNFDSIGE